MHLAIIAGFVGGQELIIILIVVLLLFGGRKIPELMKGLGRGMKEFKKASAGEPDEDERPKKDTDKITE